MRDKILQEREGFYLLQKCINQHPLLLQRAANAHQIFFEQFFCCKNATILKYIFIFYIII